MLAWFISGLACTSPAEISCGEGTELVDGECVVSEEDETPGDVDTAKPADSGDLGDDDPGLVQGEDVTDYYFDTCSGCHGVYREGSVGPALLPDRLTEDRAFYFDVIKDGVEDTTMNPTYGWADLTDADIDALVDFIFSEPEASDIVWGIDEITATIEELIAEEDWPSEPTHDAHLDELMLVTKREDRGIALFDGEKLERLDDFEASYRAHGYAFDPTDSRWAYNVGRDGWLFKIDLFSLKSVAKVRVGIDSRGLAISDDGDTLMVGNYIPHTAVLIDTDSFEPLKVLETEGVDPNGDYVSSRVCAVNALSSHLGGPYFIIQLKEAGQAWRIDYSDPDFAVAKLEDVGETLHEGFSTPDQRTHYATSQGSGWMTAIDVESWTILEKIPTAAQPHPGPGAIWEASNGAEYAATLHLSEGLVAIWDTHTNTPVAEIETGGAGLFVRTTDETPYVWADALFSSDAPGTVYAFEKDPPFRTYAVEVEGCQKCLHPEPTANGDYVFISDWDGNQVFVYDAWTLEHVKTFEDVTTPTGIFSAARRYETMGH